MTVVREFRGSHGSGFDAGPLPSWGLGYPLQPSVEVSKLLGTFSDVPWHWVFQPDRLARVAPDEEATFLDFYDATYGTDLQEPNGKRWRASGANLPVVALTDGTFGGRASITFNDTVTPSGLVRRKYTVAPPANFTLFFVFDWQRPGSNGVNKTLMHYLTTGSVEGIRLVLNRNTDTVDRVIFNVDHAGGITPHIYSTTAPLANGPHVIGVGFDGDGGNKVEIWLDDLGMISSGTLTGGVDTGAALNMATIGSGGAGSSPFNGKISLGAMAEISLTKRDGSSNLVYRDYMDFFMRGLMALHEVPFTA